jgi:hypothetical protein
MCVPQRKALSGAANGHGTQSHGAHSGIETINMELAPRPGCVGLLPTGHANLGGRGRSASRAETLTALLYLALGYPVTLAALLFLPLHYPRYRCTNAGELGTSTRCFSVWFGHQRALGDSPSRWCHNAFATAAAAGV